MSYLQLNGGTLHHLTKAEFSYVSAQIVSRVEADGIESLKIPQEMFDSYKEHAKLLSDLVAKSRISQETVMIAEVRENVKTTLLDFFTSIRAAKKSSLASRKEAGTFLYNLAKPCVGAYRLALRTLIEKVKTLLGELSKDDATPHVVTLGLNDVIAQLSSLNARLGVLVDTRAVNQLANETETSYKLRKEMNEMFKSMMFVVIGSNLLEPTDVRTDFIAYVEKVIAEATTESRQRKAQSGKKTGESDAASDATTGETPSEGTSEEIAQAV